MAGMISFVKNVSDTALWAAAFRAQETMRSDALFRDPFAARLAGPRGFEIAGALSTAANSISWVTRTYLFDEFLVREIANGVDLVLNLGAGLDTRPYRMALPRDLQWVEIDAPEIVAHKKTVLRGEKPNCSVERISLDLRDLDATRMLLRKLNQRAGKIVVLTEGVLIYLSAKDVAGLASELSGLNNFRAWVLEIVSPEVLQNMKLTSGVRIDTEEAPFQFGPAEGPNFFKPYGWKVGEVRGVLKTAVKLGRTPIEPQLSHLVPDSPDSGLPWIGVCVLEPHEPGGVSPI
jgi:methyltransferase (TIGR00027 family)